MFFDLIYNDPLFFSLAFLIGLFAGIIKGVVGFAMPMILLSGLSSFMTAEIALAALILPTLVTNFKQAFSPRGPTIITSLKRFRLFLIVGGVFLIISSQLTPYLPSQIFMGILGILIFTFSLFQILGMKFPLKESNNKITFSLASLNGLIGGISGIWGPLTVTYLTALNLGKDEQIKVQGIVYGLGSILLLLGHINSGIFTWYTASFSASLIFPALIGLWVGTAIRDQINQTTFRKVTLIILLFAGGNLIRRAWFG